MKFVKGMDLSTLAELEKCGAKYYDNGEEKDILEIMKSYDVDTIRIRVWNDPWSETGESYGAGRDLSGFRTVDAAYGRLPVGKSTGN